MLFVDLRAFSTLVDTQLPYDLVVLLNRFVGEMREAVEGHSGRVTMFLSDGLMAVFGLNGEADHGSRHGIAAARAMLRAVDAMNDELHAALTIPIRIGIGVHTGPLVMARIGDEGRGFQTTALGESVSIASKLEEATKSVLADCLISDATFAASGRRVERAGTHKVNVPGQDEPMTAYSITADARREDDETMGDEPEASAHGGATESVTA
ncbi:MAG: adenylate/guanylate cyclase domain-containing protein [Pseudomonadota bacterium]